MLKKIVSLVFLCLLFFIITGCGDLEPSKVTKKYVHNQFEETLIDAFGTDFVINIISFDSKSEKREAIAEAYPKIDSSLKFQIIGSIEADYFKGSKFGTSYHMKHNFDDILWTKIDKELANKGYSFEIGEGANYSLVAANIRNYMMQFRELLDNYKTGRSIEIYFREEYKTATIPLTINGVDVDKYSKRISIDDSNGKVIVDKSRGAYAGQGELEIEEFLQLLATGQLEKKVDEIRCSYGYAPFHGNAC